MATLGTVDAAQDRSVDVVLVRGWKSFRKKFFPISHLAERMKTLLQAQTLSCGNVE